MIITEFERQKEMARLKRSRHDTFQLRSSECINEGDDEQNSCENDFNNNKSMFDKLKSKIGFSNHSVHEDKIKENHQISVSQSSSPLKKPRSASDIKRDFQIDDIIDFVNKGINTIVDDEVTKRFTTEGNNIKTIYIYLFI